MKYLIVLAAATALAGCSKPAEQEPAAQAPEAAATQPAQVMAADGQPAPGTYRVTTEGGDVFTGNRHDASPNSAIKASRPLTSRELSVPTGHPTISAASL